QVLLGALVLAVGDVEGVEELAVLLLRAHDLDVVVHLGAEQLEHLVGHRLGGRHHLAEVEQHLHQRRRVGVDLLGEVGERRAARQPDRLAVALGQADTAHRGRLHRVELLALLPLRLAALARRAAGTAERTRGTAATATATTGATTAGTTAETARRGAATGTEATARTRSEERRVGKGEGGTGAPDR